MPQTCSHRKFWKTTMTSYFFLTRRKMVLIVQPRIAMNMKEAWFCISSSLRCYFMFYWRKNTCPVKNGGLRITLYVAFELLRMVLKCRSCIFQPFFVGPPAQWTLLSCADCSHKPVCFTVENVNEGSVASRPDKGVPLGWGAKGLSDCRIVSRGILKKESVRAKSGNLYLKHFLGSCWWHFLESMVTELGRIPLKT